MFINSHPEPFGFYQASLDKWTSVSQLLLLTVASVTDNHSIISCPVTAISATNLLIDKGRANTGHKQRERGRRISRVAM